MAILNGNETLSSVKYTQVYQATHKGENRLPFMKRSFISFSFDGKPIEDFNLIATTVSNNLNKDAYADFEDITSSYDNLDGQQYWSTHYKTNTLDFTLATDGIDQRTLDNFKNWFQAGKTKELVLAEHPNRAILARVERPPHLNLLPFEGLVQMKVSDASYTVHTTLYKGEITLSFVMDEPHWYALTNILGKIQNNAYVDLWDDITVDPPQEISIFASQDALKILYEDGIPLGSMIEQDMLLGNGAFAKVNNVDISLTWSVEDDILTYEDNDMTKPESGTGAKIEANNASYPYELGIIAGAIIDANGHGISTLPVYDDSQAENTVGYFYYSGTAPAPTVLTFTLQPVVDPNTGYINVPYNSHTSNKYNTITIESINKQELHFTTPNVFTSYNKAMEIFNTYINNETTYSWEDIRNKLREEVRHSAAREWAIQTVNLQQENEVIITNNGVLGNVREEMMKFLQTSENDSSIPKCTFSFNSETGEAFGEFQYRKIDNYNQIVVNPIKENVGDMLRSNYLVIRDRNFPTESGLIRGWKADEKINSHIIYHDVPGGLEKVQLLYKNMYL